MVSVGVICEAQSYRCAALREDRAVDLRRALTDEDQAGAQKLLHLTRQHWGIENRVFYVRDVTMGEDHCRVRTGPGPIILSTLRNAALNLLNGNAVKNKAAALRRHAAHPHQALALIQNKDDY